MDKSISSSLVFSKAMALPVRFGLFKPYYVPIRSLEVGPLDDDIASDEELVFRVLKPNRLVNCGLLMSWATGWHQHEGGTSRLSSQFPWAGAAFVFEEPGAARLPWL